MSTKVKVGIIGTGGWGTSLLSNLLKIDGVEIVAVCDLDKTRMIHGAL